MKRLRTRLIGQLVSLTVSTALTASFLPLPIMASVRSKAQIQVGVQQTPAATQTPPCALPSATAIPAPTATTTPSETVAATVSSTPTPTPIPVTEDSIISRLRDQKGIAVDHPKIYDDALLQQMLRSAEARLANLQLIDQASILAKLGAVSGASQDTSGFAFNIQGAPVPQVKTTTKLPTETTTTSDETTPQGQSTKSQTVSNLAVQDVETTRAGFSPPSAAAPAPTTTLPSGFSVASSDILNEQMQLTAEINGLRLLLAGSLSDYFIETADSSRRELPKFKTTLGFGISLTPDRRYKEAVAIVEVEVGARQSLSGELPAVTAILPREKTYNVAAITDRSVSIGGGVATQILGFSGSWISGRKTHYLVQDQDTIALTYKPTDPTKSGFTWQFRPVLGNKYVKGGLKQTFVQLAFPTLSDARSGEIGQVTVRTYWRKYDPKKGVLKDVIRGTFKETYHDLDIRSFRQPVLPSAFNEEAAIEDLGGGQVLVKLVGRFLPGTAVRLGSSLLTESARFKHEYHGIRFQSTTAELATKPAYVVAHDGREKELTTFCSLKRRPQITCVESARVDDNTSKLFVRLKLSPEVTDTNPPKFYLVIGQRVFGDVDTPLNLESHGDDLRLTALVPNTIFVPNARLVVRTLMAPSQCSSEPYDVSGKKPDGDPKKVGITALEQGRTTSSFLLTGKELKKLSLLSPDSHSWKEISDEMRILILPTGSLKDNKQLLLQRTSDKPFLLTIPEFETKKLATPKALGSISVNADEIVIAGEGFNDLEGLTFREQPVTTFKVVNDLTLRISGLAELGLTSSAGTKRIFIKFKSSSRPLEVDIQVVNNIISNRSN